MFTKCSHCVRIFMRTKIVSKKASAGCSRLSGGVVYLDCVLSSVIYGVWWLTLRHRPFLDSHLDQAQFQIQLNIFARVY
jgi:hypothetical protein